MEDENIFEMVDRIITEFAETQDKFIFKTIYPYCTEVVQAEIDKKELEMILLKAKEPQRWIPSDDGQYYCTRCGEKSREMSQYCPKCGQLMNYTESEGKK